MKKFLVIALFICSSSAFSQSNRADELTIRSIFDEALKNGKCYQLLDQLTHNIGPRLSGSAGAESAVQWSEQVMKDYQFDSVWLQPLTVTHWIRGSSEVAWILNAKNEKIPLHVTALGGSVGTGPQGISAKIIEVSSFDELKAIGAKGVKGKIVFFNRPMDATQISTFAAYSGAVGQRAVGPSEAAMLGAVAVIVRSMGLNPEDYPHTGGLKYTENVARIPAIAVSTKHADMLSAMIRAQKDAQAYIETHCEMLEDAPSFNVVGEIRGGEYADEIIVVGGHLDSWDLAQGAHDDGAGCVQSIEVLRILKTMGYKPSRTIRAVMFMNEENGGHGGLKYAELSAKNKEKHIAAIESDRGGFTPRGFVLSGNATAKSKVISWKPLFEIYGLTDFSEEGSGADVEPLKEQGALVGEFLPDSQRYFDYHHTREDTFDKVSKRELELGAASMAALVYLMDKYGLK